MHDETSMEFIQPDLPDDRYKKLLEYQMPSESLRFHPVATFSRGGRKDGLPYSAPFAWKDLPPLGEFNPPSEEEKLARKYEKYEQHKSEEPPADTAPTLFD